MPKEEGQKSILLNMELNIGSKENEIKIQMAADMVFELEFAPKDYDELAENKLVPMARESLLNSLDDILVAMGYNKMELAVKTS